MAAIGLVAVLLAGCGGGSGSEVAQTTEAAETHAERPKTLRQLTVTLDGWEGPQTVGMLMAEKRGYFTDVGLDPEILVPVFPWRPIKYVVHGVDDLGVSQQPQIVLAKAKGAPIKAVGSLVSQPTAAMIWLKKSKISGIADLRGKTVAVPGIPYQGKLLRHLLARGGLAPGDVKIKRVTYELVPALVSGRADAIFGGAWNVQGAELEARGLDPVITRVQGSGVPAYDELEVIGRSDRIAREPRLIRAFMSAVAHGTAAAIEDPKAAVNVLVGASESNPNDSRKWIEAETEATLPLLSRSGYVSPAQARHLVNWMHEEGMIRRKVPVATLLTNRYLPAAP